MAVAYSQRRFQARGADVARVSLALLVAGVVSTVAFAIIVGIGAMASGDPAASMVGLLTSLGVAVAAGCLVAVLHSPRGRARLRPAVRLAVRSGQRLAHGPAGDARDIAAGCWSGSVRSISACQRLPPRSHGRWSTGRPTPRASPR
jgi:hypothetical protein